MSPSFTWNLDLGVSNFFFASKVSRSLESNETGTYGLLSVFTKWLKHRGMEKTG
jgi:hypothetical protein